MSKYSLKLEQIISKEEFGDILLTVQYDYTGPKIVSADVENLSQASRSQLQLVLNMINFCLTKGISVSELDGFIKVEENDEINILIETLVAELDQLPVSLSQINQEDVMEVTTEILKELNQ